jgi:hypothetical protein
MAVDIGYPWGMQQNTARHSLTLPAIGAVLALVAVTVLGFALFGWATHGAEMFYALSAAGLAWCM